MTIHLKPEIEALIAEDVKRGRTVPRMNSLKKRCASYTPRKIGWSAIAVRSKAQLKKDLRRRNGVSC